MLLAGVFGNAAMAADGDGTVAVTTPNAQTPFNAGASERLIMTYRNVDPDDNTKVIDMAGGKVQINFPSGWKVSNKNILIEDPVGTTVYRTTADGKVDETSQGGTADSRKRVAFTADKKIEVTLGNDWNVSRTLTLTFGSDGDLVGGATAPVPSKPTLYPSG